MALRDVVDTARVVKRNKTKREERKGSSSPSKEKRLRISCNIKSTEKLTEVEIVRV